MGYALTIFNADKLDAVTGGELLNWLEDFCASSQDVCENSLPSRLAGFYRELTREFPAVSPDPRIVDTEHVRYILTSGAIHLDIPFAQADQVCTRACTLSHTYELGYFDGHNERVVLPEKVTKRLEEKRRQAGEDAAAARRKRSGSAGKMRPAMRCTRFLRRWLPS